MARAFRPWYARCLRSAAMKKRSLWPKEHGAWAQLAFPMATALIAGKWTLATGVFVLAAVFAFFVHEPAAVLLGVRGTRARRENLTRARLWVASFGAAAVATGALGFVLAPGARVAALAAIAFAGLTALLLYERKERTPAGEIVAATALAGAAAPVGAASGLSTFWILACWAVWAASSAMSTLAVHAIVLHARAWPTLVVAAGALAVGVLVGRYVALALAPMGVVCSAIVLSSISVKSIRSAGWALAVAMCLSAASLAVGARS